VTRGRPVPAGGLLGRVLGGVDDTRDLCLEDRLRAGGLATGVGAGLEGDVEGGTCRVVAPFAAVLDRGALGVQAAEFGVEALPDHLLVACKDRADQRVRAHPASAALGELERPAQMGRLQFGVDRGHPRPPD